MATGHASRHIVHCELELADERQADLLSLTTYY